MKNNFKKMISVGVAGVSLVSLLLSGCGGNGQKTGEVYNIDWYLVQGITPTDDATVEAAVNEYLKEKGISATLDMHYLGWGEYDRKVNLMISGGEKFDICYTSAGNGYRNNATKNAFKPLDELIDEYAPKTKEILGEDFLEGSRVNGKIFGIPANKDKGHHNGVMYRTDIAEKYGLTEQLQNAKTMADIYPVLDIIKAKEPEMIPLLEYGVYSETALIEFDTIMFPAGIYLDGRDNKVVNLIETPEFKELTMKTRENFEKGYNVKGFGVKKEKHFMEFVGLKPGKDKEMAGSRDYDYTQIDGLNDAYMTTADATGSLMAILNTSKNPEICMQFLELLNTDEYLNNLIVFGVEGIHYNKVEDKVIEPIKDSGYGNAGMQWEFGNTFLNYTLVGEDTNKNVLMEKYNSNLLTSPALGFSFDVNPVKIEAGACENVRAEFHERLGQGDEANQEEILNQYIDKLKAAGADKIVEEVQKQYDEWRAQK